VSFKPWKLKKAVYQILASGSRFGCRQKGTKGDVVDKEDKLQSHSTAPGQVSLSKTGIFPAWKFQGYRNDW
jgi:hypothetical protein